MMVGKFKSISRKDGTLTFLEGYNHINHQYYSRLLQNWITFATFGAIIIDLTKDNMLNTNHKKLKL
jgi:hypothetical protein